MPPASAFTILILKADRYYAHAIRRSVADTFPGAHVQLAVRLHDVAELLAASAIDLLLPGVQVLDGDVIEALANWTREPRRVKRVLVVTGRRERRVLATLMDLPVDGIFDPSTDEPEEFETALRHVADGRCYWSRSVLQAVGTRRHQIPNAECALTPTEQLVFALIGDGCDDTTAAEHLDLEAATIRSVREQLHRKLHVRHKGELVRLAGQLGFVCIGAHGVIRPGFSQLLAAREARKSRCAPVAGRGNQAACSVRS